MTERKALNELRVAIAGLGSIGSKIASALDQGIEGLTLSAVAVRDPAKHQAFISGLRRPPSVLPIDQLGDAADIVVECAPSSQLRAIVERARELLRFNARPGAAAGRVTTTDPRTGARLAPTQLWVYRRAGRPCHRCGTPISVGSANEKPYERPVFWCPTCQAPSSK